MVRTRARGFDRIAPHGVAHGFQITSHKSEPFRRARNLLSKHDCRSALPNKAEPYGPQVAFVGEAFALAGGAERLTGTAPGPYWLVVGPSSKSESVRPASNAGEEMVLRVPSKVVGMNYLYVPLVHVARRDMTRSDQVAKPLRRIRVYLVVIGFHALLPSLLSQCTTPPPADVRHACNQEGLQAMRSGLSDQVAGAVIEQCLAARGYPVR